MAAEQIPSDIRAWYKSEPQLGVPQVYDELVLQDSARVGPLNWLAVRL